MKICIISGAFPPQKDGVGDGTYRIATALGKKNLEIKVITANEAKKIDGLNVLPVMKSWGFVELKRLMQIVRDYMPEIVLLQAGCPQYGRSPMINLFPLFLRWFSPKLQTVVIIHEFEVYRVRGKLRQFLTMLCSHRIVIVDKREAAHITAFAGIFKSVLEKKFAFVSLGSQIDVQSHEQNVAIVKNERLFTISFFGFIYPHKGVETLIRAFGSLLAEGLNVRLIFIGEFDPANNNYHQTIRALIDSLPDENAIHFIGYCTPEQVSHHLKAADAMVLPFDDGVAENRGSFLAAMAHGCAVITTTATLLPPQLTHRHNAMLIAPQSPQALAAAIKELYHDPQLKARLGNEARAWSQKYSWDKVATDLIVIFQELQKTSLKQRPEDKNE